MPERGVNDDGISTPSYSEILDYFAKRWEDEFGTQADLSSRTPEGQLFRTIAESISNKGLPWSDITSIWDTIEDVYNSGFIETSSGASLDHLVALRGLTRKRAQPSSGTLVFHHDEGVEIPRGTVAWTDQNLKFETIRPAVVNRYGIAPVPARATIDGPEGNVVAYTIWDSDGGDVENPIDTHSFHIGSVVDKWGTITNSPTADKYQRLPINDLKYATNVDEVTLRVRANDSGLYGIYMLILGYESGEEFYRTEMKDMTLDEGEIRDITFKGEGFDLLSEDIGEEVRLVPMNAGYSASGVDVALERVNEGGGWYIAEAEQTASLYSKITTSVKGDFTGGRNRETDTELKNRYLSSLSRGGSTRPSAIKSELYSIDSIKFVRVRENNKAIDFRPDGLPPNSIEVIVWGGSNEDVLQALLDSKPAGVNTYGDRVGVIEDELGQVHNFRYSRANEVEVHIEIDAVTSRTFPAGGGERIKNICAKVVGGEDLDGVFHPGRVGVGDTLYQSELESELHDRISGLRSVQTAFGRDDESMEDQDLELGPYETTITRPEHIYINRGK